MIKTKLLLFVSALILQHNIFACGGLNQQVYTGQISFIKSPTDPLTCTVFVMLDFDIPDVLGNDSITIDWGDSTQGSIFADEIYGDTLANIIQEYGRFYKHFYSGTHTYSALPASGFYYASVASQYRISYINNIENGVDVNVPYYIEATIGMDTTAGFSYKQMPVSPPLTISYGYIDTSFNQNIFLYDPEGDSIVFDFVTPLEGHNTPVPLYMMPDNFCAAVGESTSFSINHQTGEITWANPCFTGIFSIATKISKYRNGHLLGSNMLDQNVFVSAHSPTGIQKLADNRFQIFPNPGNSFIQLQTGEPLTISILNMLGETIRKQNIPSSAPLDISDLKSGIYFIRDEKTSAVARFVKQ